MSIDVNTSLQNQKPAIMVSQSDHDRLVKLANSAPDKTAEIADVLLSELDRASVVDDLPRGVVGMNSTVEYQTEDGQKRRVTLVYPGQADIALGKISILTPIGTALIGLSAGQSIDWTALDGRRHLLTIIAVESCQALADEGG